MKFAKLPLVVALPLACPAASGQITLKERKAPLNKVLSDIEKQTKYVFLYDPGALKTPPVTISIKNATLEKTLAQVFKNLPIEFTLVYNNVLLRTKRTTTAQPINDIIVRGKVVDSTGQPLSGVTILNKRDRKATQTDSTGIYTLKVAKDDILRFSYVGYKDQDIIVGKQPMINAILEIIPSSADQVVEAITLSSGDLATAKTLLTTVMSHAGAGPQEMAAVAAATTPAALQLEIVKENMRNFAYENGVDWFALRRLPFATIQQLNPYIKDPTRLIWPIPTSELSENPVFQNPGY